MIKKTIGWILTVFGVLALLKAVTVVVYPSLHAALFSPAWMIDFFSALIGGAIGLTLGKKLRATPKAQ
jgi:hypothetical protein